jgi:hypothetical protein
MARRIDPRYGSALIDAHILDPLDTEETNAVDEIISLCEETHVNVLLPHSVKVEIEHPNTPARVKRRTQNFIYTEPVSLTDGEVETHRRVRDLIRGNAKPGKHDSDAYHLVEAAKYGRFFITCDRRLLDKRLEVAAVLGRDFHIMTPTEYVAAYHHAIAADQVTWGAR